MENMKERLEGTEIRMSMSNTYLINKEYVKHTRDNIQSKNWWPRQQNTDSGDPLDLNISHKIDKRILRSKHTVEHQV